MKRPLLWVALLYEAGILVGEYWQLRWQWLAAIVLITAAAALLISRARPYLLLPLILLTGCLGLTLSKAVLSPNDLRTIFLDKSALTAVHGTVCRAATTRDYYEGRRDVWRTTLQMDLTEVQLKDEPWEAAHGQVAITVGGSLTNCFPGQVVEADGVMALPKSAVAPGLFDYRAYLSRVGIYYHLTVSSLGDWKVISSPAKPPVAERFRAWACKALAIGLPREDEPLRLEWALTLGWRAALTEEVAEPFIRAATYHIFAVDGLRMAIVFGICFQILRFGRTPRPIAGVILLPIIWGYVALTGWPASAIRASVMLSIVIVGWVLKRPLDLLNSLFAAALVILICDPQQLFQSGFQLSFFVVLSIILLMPVFEKFTERIFRHDPLLPPELRTKWHPWVSAAAWFAWETLLVSLAAWIGSLPLSAYYFNIVSPVSTPANLVAVPLCILVLISNLVSLLFAAWWPGVAAIFNHSGWAMMSLIAKTSTWFAGWPKAYAYVSAPGVYGTCLFYAVLVAITTGWLFKPRFRLLKVSALGMSLTVWGILLFKEVSTPTLTVLPLNDSNVVLYSEAFGRERALMNSGSAFASDFTVKPFMRAQGVNQLENLILTHGEAHVAAGASTVASMFDVRRIWVSAISGRPASGYRRYVSGVENPKTKIVQLRHAETNGVWTVLHPSEEDRFTRTEDAALVLHGTVKGTRVLMLSELTDVGQRILIERHPELRAEIVIAGMPGRGEPVIDSLLDVVQPKLIVIGDQEAPAMRRATKALRDRLAARKIPVIYTTESGAVTFGFKPGGWEMKRMKDEPRSRW